MKPAAGNNFRLYFLFQFNLCENAYAKPIHACAGHTFVAAEYTDAGQIEYDKVCCLSLPCIPDIRLDSVEWFYEHVDAGKP